jgi:predicted ABC-type ATPase
MNLRSLLSELREKDDDIPVGSVRIRGQSRVQKQRDGSWMRLGPARPGEAPPPKLRRDALALPPSQKRSPSVKEIDMPLNRTWQDEAPDMPQSSIDQNFKDEEPKPGRKALHERILRTFSDHVDEVPADKMPVAVLTMGGPISGRSSFVKNLASDASFVRVDPGAIATIIPEYEEAVKKTARNAAAIVQEEAAYVAHRLIEEAVEKRKNVAIDAVGLDADAHTEFLQDLQDKGYYTVLVLTDLDRADAILRNKARGLRTGRWVPREALVLGKVAAKNFDAVADAADESIRIDVRGGYPKHIVETLVDLQNLFEEEPEEAEEPDVPAVTSKEIKKRALEGIRKEKVRMAALPDKYKTGEGILLAHYDDAHIQPLDFGEEDDGEGDDDQEPEA